MLTKVLKYDIKAMAKNLLPFYGLTILMAGFSRFTGFLADKFSFLKFVNVMITTLFILLLIGCFIYTFIVTIQRFYNNLIKDEGYLTHTLPVKKSTLINAKLISSLLYAALSIVVVIIALLIRLYTPGCLTPIFELIRSFLLEAGYNETMLIIYMIVMTIVSYLTNVLMIYLAICLGQTRNEKKGLYSFIYGIVVYYAMEAVCGVFIFIMMFANKGFMSELDKAVPSASALYYLFGITTVIMAVFPVIFYVLSVKLLDKKLNLE